LILTTIRIGQAGGIEAKIISTKLTSDLLMKHWDEMVRYVQKERRVIQHFRWSCPTRRLQVTLNCKAAE